MRIQILILGFKELINYSRRNFNTNTILKKSCIILLTYQFSYLFAFILVFSFFLTRIFNIYSYFSFLSFTFDNFSVLKRIHLVKHTYLIGKIAERVLDILYLLLNVIPGQLCLCNLFRWSVSIHADAHSSHERFSLLVLACVASGAEMGRRLGGREKGGGLAREDKVSSSSLFPFALFSLSSSPSPSPFCACYSGYVRLQ